jgi:hypothetical protein
MGCGGGPCLLDNLPTRRSSFVFDQTAPVLLTDKELNVGRTLSRLSWAVVGGMFIGTPRGF